MQIEILFQDSVLLIVNKPAGLPVHKTVDPLRPDLQSILEQQMGQKLVLFHRLDADTTGCLCLGKDPSINKAMTDVFRDREAKKIYWAMVEGRLSPGTHKVETYIRKVSGGRYINAYKGRKDEQALSKVRSVEFKNDRTFVEVEILTGRTHQVRLHCLELKHPVLGDPLYGRRDPSGVPIALHARHLSMAHPVSGQRISVHAPLPSYWAEHWAREIEAIK